jgi:hypothetical protein
MGDNCEPGLAKKIKPTNLRPYAQRIGSAYMSPSFVHSLFGPKLVLTNSKPAVVFLRSRLLSDPAMAPGPQ